MKLVRTFAKEFGLAVVPDPLSLECRIIKLAGTMAAMQKAFGVTLTHKTYDGATYRVRQGSITLPAELVGPVEAVLGLDNRPQAQPHFRIAGQRGDLAANAAQAGGFAHPHIAIPNAAATNISYTPPQIATLYQFPANASAAGQTIGLLELGGGYKTADLTAYFKTLGQKPPKSPQSPSTAAKTAPAPSTAPTAKSCSTSKSPPP
ncbi:hypothetical protein RBB78_22050 [Tunturiibacter empetritectus]|uniref:protease pro-enzyme activation domain-containing protein n=1 Tax=Tunturiibacter empetritectus TaxID=3069691 RepID=UPI003D9BA6A4